MAHASIARYEATEPDLNAFISLDPNRVTRRRGSTGDRGQARRVLRGSLHGVPIAVKDNIATRGERTTAGSKVYRAFDCPTVTRPSWSGCVPRALWCSARRICRSSPTVQSMPTTSDLPVTLGSEPVRRRSSMGSGCRGRGRRGARRTGHRHDGLDPKPRDMVRRRRPQAFVRTRPVAWCHPAGGEPRSRRPASRARPPTVPAFST